MKRVLCLSAVSVNLLLLLPSAGLAGDNSPGQDRLTENQMHNAGPSRTFDVVVESKPPGSIITVNNNACGRAPCRLRITTQTNDKGVIEIKAIPFLIGQFVRTQFFAEAGGIPDHLQFDNRVPPPDPAVNVYFY